MHFLDVIWDTKCGLRSGTDAPSAVVSLRVSGVERTISDDLGDDCTPKQLRLVEDLVDLVTKARKWTSCASTSCCRVCPGEDVGKSMLHFCEHRD